MTRAHDHFAFLDRSREDPDVFPLKVRRTEFREIYKPFSQEEAADQAERCLDCGNPYCEWKCPVHNYIPNWLKLASEGRILEAADLGTWEWEVQTGETRFNERCAEMLGYSLAELEPVSIETWEKFVHPEDIATGTQALTRTFEEQHRLRSSLLVKRVQKGLQVVGAHEDPSRFVVLEVGLEPTRLINGGF